MAIDRHGEFWRGEDLTDLADYLPEFQPGGYPVERVKKVFCLRCEGKAFSVLADDAEGCAQVGCMVCGERAFIADSADYWLDAEPDECACPCGGEVFHVAIGFALGTDGEVRWISLGLRCIQDGTVGVYADWKIDYGPTDHLLVDAD
ncbi:hypothetical protein [Micromonospora coxensis]|uniref:hypothetical protein n=1 Tax=Micromonospora coxensis TaxID=356852 RepID=UPI0034343825